VNVQFFGEQQKLTIIVIKEVVVVNVSFTETEGGSTGVQVLPVVVGICDPQVGILITIAVRVSNKRRLVVVVEVGVGDGNTRGSVGDIQKTIVAVYSSYCKCDSQSCKNKCVRTSLCRGPSCWKDQDGQSRP
jgi:hypothetical protein